MLFLGSLSWDIFKKTNESLPAKTITWNFPWFTKLEDKLDIAGIPERPFRKRGHHKYQPCTLSTPPNHVFQNKSNKTDCKTWKKTSSQQPPFPSFPQLDHRHIIKARRWSCRWWDGHPVSQRVTGHTWTKSSYRGFNCRGSWYHRHHPGNGWVDRVMQGSIDDSEMLWIALQNTKPFIQARPLLN